MESMHPILTTLEKSGQRSVLATIVGVQGSSYRKVGTAMLLLENGSRIGILSGGCLEADLAERAAAGGYEEEPAVRSYDLRSEDDLAWGRGVGCAGVIDVLTEPVTPALRQQLLEAKRALDNGMAVTIIKGVAAETLGTNRIELGVGGDSFAHDVSRWFVRCVLPKPRLLLFGAGEDARPVAELAAKTGFAVIVLDRRAAMCCSDFFPGAAACIVGSVDEAIAAVAVRPDDYAVVMTHDFVQDQSILRALCSFKLRYIGLLGARERTSRLLGSDARPAGLRSPVGLSIGAEGPEEIAVSIVAELLQQVHADRSSKHEAISLW
jgi:xanthine dehydrogenase accessory factor